MHQSRGARGFRDIFDEYKTRIQTLGVNLGVNLSTLERLLIQASSKLKSGSVYPIIRIPTIFRRPSRGGYALFAVSPW